MLLIYSMCTKPLVNLTPDWYLKPVTIEKFSKLFRLVPYIWFSTVLSGQKNPYHLVTRSPWPLLLSIFLGLFTMLVVIKFHYQIHYIWLHISIYTNIFVITNWCINVLTESFLGMHTRKVRQGLRLGFFLMIISEIMFFFSFIWTLFFYNLFLVIWTGFKSPYIWGLPEMNATPWTGTWFLITSAYWISSAKVRFQFGKIRQSLYELLMTFWCGIMFLIVQVEEFVSLKLTFNCGSQANIFFMLTGFHGLHVLIGMVFIYFLYARMLDGKYIPVREKHILFDITVWYWHFVDYVWIFLFIVLYGFYGQFLLPLPQI